MSCRTVDPIRLRIITSNPAQIVRGSDSFFASFVDQLRIELDPTTLMEALLVEQIILGATRMRQAARQEQPDSGADAKWLRFQSMAERSFWKALNTFEKHRRQAARAAKAEQAKPTPQPQPAPSPSPEAKPAPTPTPTPTPAPAPRLAERRQFVERVLSQPLPISDRLDLAILPPFAHDSRPLPIAV